MQSVQVIFYPSVLFLMIKTSQSAREKVESYCKIHICSFVSSRYFLKEIENMFSVFLSSCRNMVLNQIAVYNFKTAWIKFVYTR